MSIMHCGLSHVTMINKKCRGKQFSEPSYLELHIPNGSALIAEMAGPYAP